MRLVARVSAKGRVKRQVANKVDAGASCVLCKLWLCNVWRQLQTIRLGPLPFATPLITSILAANLATAFATAFTLTSTGLRRLSCIGWINRTGPVSLAISPTTSSAFICPIHVRLPLVFGDDDNGVPGFGGPGLPLIGV